MMTRKDLRDELKMSFGLDPTIEDGNLSDYWFNKAIDNAIKKSAHDCNLVPVEKYFPMSANQWRYPMDDDVDRIRSVSFIDSNGQYTPLDYVNPQEFMRNLQPSTDLSPTPLVFSYPLKQNAVVEFWAGAPPIYDYITESYVTEGTVRTLVDSGANFGMTRNNYRIEPGCKVFNITDGSYGILEVLGITTTKANGTADTTTNTANLIDAGVDFVALDVQISDIICVTVGGLVKSYAFVTSVAQHQLGYESCRGLRTNIRSGDVYKVGKATELRLSASPPHPGLRNGVSNMFNVGNVTATMSGTSFTPTRVTGTKVGTTTTGQIAIADCGSHGLITAIGSNYLDVAMWIGGLPSGGQTIIVKTVDKYQIETKNAIQRTICIYPTPEVSDAVGSESLYVLYNKIPDLPDDDDDILEIDDQYKEVVTKCVNWQASRLSGRFSPEQLVFLESDYNAEVDKYSDDINRPPIDHPLSLWNNATASRGVAGRRFENSAGPWKLNF